ncbi:unnamed protein product, partial [Polarella glacialis]
MTKGESSDEDKDSAAFGDSHQGSEVFDEGPLELLDLLEEKVPIGSFLSLVSARSFFEASKECRVFLSSQVALCVRFGVLPPDGFSRDEVAEIKRRTQRVRCHLVQEPLTALRVYLPNVPLQQIPIRKAPLCRLLYKVMPMVKWEECTKLTWMCTGTSQVEFLERAFRKEVICLMGGEPWILLEEPRLFPSICRLEISLTQIGNLTEDLSLPQVRRLKVECRDQAFSDGALSRVGKVFPDLKRLHLQLLPVGLLPFVGPGFVAPEDFRLTLLKDRNSTDAVLGNEASMFMVASHLLSLPFSWGGGLLDRVVRLQIDELSKKHVGQSLEQFAKVVASAPLLRRLGTVSVGFTGLLDLTSESWQHLEELVVCMEIEDALKFFNVFLPLEPPRRRSSIKRLAVHLLAPDGVSKLTAEVERVMCAGWLNLATKLLHPEGFVIFSQGQNSVQ